MVFSSIQHHYKVVTVGLIEKSVNSSQISYICEADEALEAISHSLGIAMSENAARTIRLTAVHRPTVLISDSIAKIASVDGDDAFVQRRILDRITRRSGSPKIELDSPLRLRFLAPSDASLGEAESLNVVMVDMSLPPRGQHRSLSVRCRVKDAGTMCCDALIPAKIYESIRNLSAHPPEESGTSSTGAQRNGDECTKP